MTNKSIVTMTEAEEKLAEEREGDGQGGLGGGRLL